MHLKKLSAANNYQTFQAKFSIEANSADPDQIAPIGAVCSGSKLFVIEAYKTFQQLAKADDFCYDWRFTSAYDSVVVYLLIVVAPIECVGLQS